MTRICGASDNRAAQDVPHPNPLPTAGEGTSQGVSGHYPPIWYIERSRVERPSSR
jgi:hypothetical protein